MHEIERFFLSFDPAVHGACGEERILSRLQMAPTYYSLVPYPRLNSLSLDSIVIGGALSAFVYTKVSGETSDVQASFTASCRGR